jgi:hypothetical protein
MCLLRQGTGPADISLFQRRTRALRVVSNLSNRLLLGRIQSATGKLFQPVVDRTEPLFRVLALSQSFGRSNIRGHLLRRFARPAFTNHNLLWTIGRLSFCRSGLAAPRGCFRGMFGHRSGGGCCERFRRYVFFGGWFSRRLVSRSRRRRRVLLRRNFSHKWEAEPQRYSKSAHQSHNGSNGIVSYQSQERKSRCNRVPALYCREHPATRRYSWLAYPSVS